MFIQTYTASFNDDIAVALRDMRDDMSVTWDQFVKDQCVVDKEKQAWAENIAVYAAAETLNLVVHIHTLDGEPRTFRPTHANGG